MLNAAPMTEIALMLEGQDGLNWDRCQAIARTVEDSGFVGLYRSDHFTNPKGPYKDSLECWTSLTWLAAHTQRIEFGPLVSPVSFRHPANLVRMAAAVDDLSGGRLQFGIGAGWQDREHSNYGFDLGECPTRMARFREAVADRRPLSAQRRAARLRRRVLPATRAVLLPRPRRQAARTSSSAAPGNKSPCRWRPQYADEWNLSSARLSSSPRSAPTSTPSWTRRGVRRPPSAAR